MIEQKKGYSGGRYRVYRRNDPTKTVGIQNNRSKIKKQEYFSYFRTLNLANRINLSMEGWEISWQ